MEILKKIKGFENYSISQNGIVINTQTGRKLKGEKSRGYFRVSLCKESVVKRFLIHRLVAYHFLINEENKKCVNHKDGNKLNNKVSNLEWCTHSENEQHSYDFLNKINPIRKLTAENVLFIKDNAIKGHGGNIKELSLKYNVDVSTIYNILKNKYYAKNF